MEPFFRAGESQSRGRIPDNTRDQDYQLVTDHLALFDVTNYLALVIYAVTTCPGRAMKTRIPGFT